MMSGNLFRSRQFCVGSAIGWGVNLKAESKSTVRQKPLWEPVTDSRTTEVIM